ncbi:MAG TPA: DUF1570 domain-containing protein [Tepidisphaeraceae bacterium]
MVSPETLRHGLEARVTKSHLIIFLIALIFGGAPARAQTHLLPTPHYLIHTDLDDSIAKDMAQRIEGMYSEYSQRLAAFSGVSNYPRMEVYLFRQQQDYVKFTGGKIRNTGGIFLPGRNLLAAFLEGQGRQQLRRTLQHEAFHQFAYNAISPDIPIWLNEGLAQFFEEGLWNGPGLVLGESPPRRVRQLQADMKNGQLVPFAQLLPMSDERWGRRLSESRSDGAVQYNQTWAMVHFLVMARSTRGELLYRPQLLDMLRLLHSGKATANAFEVSFGTDVQGFQERFKRYAQRLKPTAEATLIENQGVLADLLTDFAREGRHFNDIESFRRHIVRGHYKLHYSMGNLEWDTDPNINVYFSDLDGSRFSSDELYLSSRTGAPMSDIVCKYNNSLLLRTRFYDAPPKGVDHDLVIEPKAVSISISK